VEHAVEIDGHRLAMVCGFVGEYLAKKGWTGGVLG